MSRALTIPEKRALAKRTHCKDLRLRGSKKALSGLLDAAAHRAGFEKSFHVWTKPMPLRGQLVLEMKLRPKSESSSELTFSTYFHQPYLVLSMLLVVPMVVAGAYWSELAVLFPLAVAMAGLIAQRSIRNQIDAAEEKLRAEIDAAITDHIIAHAEEVPKLSGQLSIAEQNEGVGALSEAD